MTGFARRERQFHRDCCLGIEDGQSSFSRNRHEAAENSGSASGISPGCSRLRARGKSSAVRPAVTAAALEVDASSWRRSCSGTDDCRTGGTAARIDALELLRWPG